MFGLLLTLTFLSICTLRVFAHEEPAKTKKENDRKEILENKISSFTVWKHEITNNKHDSINKEKLMKVSYNLKGNISEMQIYKSSNILDYKAVFGYDKDNNMLTDTDYNTDVSIAENIKYKYDNTGRVVEQINYEGESEFDSMILYEVDNNTKTLTLNKYKPIDNIEYKLI